MSKEFNPLDRIPSSSAVRKRLDAIRAEAMKLEILLRTAKEIEEADREKREAANA